MSTTQEVKQEEKQVKARPRLVFGNMTWGPGAQVNKEVATKQLEALLKEPLARVQSGPEEGKVLVDTARIYRSGDSETLLGEILKENPSWRSQISLHTKCNYMVSPMTREGITTQLNNSLKALGVEKVDIYYIHFPDIKTPIEETFSTLNDLHKEGKFAELGLSNYAAWDVVRIYYLCKNKGYVVPTVYQGLYNAIARHPEAELFPALRAFGIRSYWYNPLAGGLLTGRYSSLDEKEKLTEGRFSPQFDIVGEKDTTSALKGKTHILYGARYFKQRLLESLEVIRKACEQEKIPMAEAAIRWTLFHSKLSVKHHDGLLFGASSVSQVESNVKSYTGSELPQSIVEAYNQAWLVALADAPGAFSGYGPVAGNSDFFLKQYE